jgi:hypothetical protein
MTQILPLRNRPTIRMAVVPGARVAQNEAANAANSAEAAASSAAEALASQNAAAASASAAAASETAAETAETNAETAETSAEAAQAAAEAAKTSAESAAISAQTAETNAELAETNAESAQAAAEAARDLAQNYAASLAGTSATSLSIGTGSKVFTTQAGKQWVNGQRLRAASDDGAIVMEGEITSYSGATLTINVDFTEGAGTHADWNIGLTGARGQTGAPGAMTGPASSVDGNIATFDGTSGTAVEDSGVAVSSVYRSGGTDVAVADGGTGASTASSARDNLGLGAANSPQFNSLEIGHASDTTLARSGAGELTVEGNRIFRVGGADVPIADGGTGASDAATAFSNLKQSATESATGVIEIATAAEIRTGTDATRATTPARIFDAMAEVTLTDAASIAVDFSTGFDFVVTLGGNRSLANGSGLKVGQRGRIRVVQDGTGSRTLSFGTDYEFTGGVAPVLSTAASAQDILYYDIIAAGRVFVSLAGRAIA